jgi:hypothetical protein
VLYQARMYITNKRIVRRSFRRKSHSIRSFLRISKFAHPCFIPGISLPSSSSRQLTSLGLSKITSKGDLLNNFWICVSASFIRIKNPRTSNEHTNYRTIKKSCQTMERVMGFEPTTACLGSKNSTAELHPPEPVSF